MVALATATDVANELGRALTSQETAEVAVALDSASDYVRTVTGRKFEAGTYTVRRRACGGRVWLDSPATVTGVVSVDSAGLTTAVTGFRLRGSTLYGLGDGWVEVTYATAGTIPADIRRVVAAMAARDITEDRPQGATSYTVTKGPFSESAQFEEPTDSIEPTRAEAKVLAKYGARRFGSVSLV